MRTEAARPAVGQFDFDGLGANEASCAHHQFRAAFSKTPEISVCSFFDNWRISTTRRRSDWRAKRKCHSYFSPSEACVARGVL